MSFFHKKNVTKCLGHHYAIWTSDSNILLAQKKLFGPAKGGPQYNYGVGNPVSSLGHSDSLKYNRVK
jgi:hypothetical protein